MVSTQFIADRIGQWDTEGPQGPVTLEIYPTLRCNLNCQFCDTTERHRPPVNELTTSQWLSIIDEANAMGVKQVYVLGGGEPLARHDTPLILERIKHHKMHGMLTTNGTLMPPTLTQQLIEWEWDEIHFSIDGPTSEIHDALRGQNGAFRKTVSTVCRLAREKRKRGLEKPELVIHTVLTNQNSDRLPEFFHLANAIGVSRVDIDELIAYRPEQKKLQLSQAQRQRLPKVAQTAIDTADYYGINHRLEQYANALPTGRGNGFLDHRAEQKSPVGTLKGAPCLKAWHHLVVQADGRTSPCCVLAGEGGHAQEKPLKKVWETDEFLINIRTQMRNQQPTKRCAECSWNILMHEANIRSEL